MRKYLGYVCALALLVNLVGCGTVKGIGEDLSSVGGWLSNGSDHLKENVGKKK